MYGGKNRETKKPQPYKFEKQVICWTCTWHKLKKKMCSLMVKMTLNLDSKSDILFLYRPISIRVNKPLKQIEKIFLMQF